MKYRRAVNYNKADNTSEVHCTQVITNRMLTGRKVDRLTGCQVDMLTG